MNIPQEAKKRLTQEFEVLGPERVEQMLTNADAYGGCGGCALMAAMGCDSDASYTLRLARLRAGREVVAECLGAVDTTYSSLIEALYEGWFEDEEINSDEILKDLAEEWLEKHEVTHKVVPEESKV